jgi:hypothetical protein
MSKHDKIVGLNVIGREIVVCKLSASRNDVDRTEGRTWF